MMGWIALATLALGAIDPDGASHRVFADVEESATFIATGAVVLDARGDDAPPPFLPGARTIDWKATRDGIGRTGRLDDNLDTLARALGAVGVTGAQPILVYGAMREGWGEEGRIFWMLRYLGLSHVRILDGGLAAWIAAGRPTQGRPLPRIEAAALKTPRLTPDRGLRADHLAVEAARKTPHALVLDVRSAAEWRGATPYFEARGGHVPGARHLEWTALFGEGNRVRPGVEVRRALERLGAGSQTPIIVYCTGGVRSAFVLAVLLDAGFEKVSNYDGSWFDWSKRRELPASEGD